jgi:hypothetical protein
MQAHFKHISLRTFQWYNELFNAMNFDQRNRSMEIGDSVRTPTPKVRGHLRACGLIPSHFLAILGM